MKKVFLFLTLISVSVFANPKQKQIRTGKHDIRLQWLETKKAGSAEIQKISDGVYKIEGEQKSKNGDYLTINGELTVISSKELHFVGDIVTKVSYIFEGNPCLRSGKQIFLAHGKRKYWRMKEKINCDGVVTDYVDIFF
jgi:hypothetical protein